MKRKGGKGKELKKNTVKSCVVVNNVFVYVIVTVIIQYHILSKC